METCKECGGKLEVIDADDATIIVECKECHEVYQLEPDGLGEGGFEWVDAMAAKSWKGEEE